MPIFREKDMGPAVIALLESFGLEAVEEPHLPVNGTCRRAVDVVGWSAAAVVAVELKTAFSRKLVEQCASCRYGATEVYACVPAGSVDDEAISTLADRGIGLVSWSPISRSAWIVVQAPRNVPPLAQANEWRRRLARAKRGGTPGSFGSDSGKRTLDDLVAFARANPGASWRRAWREVGNTCDGFRQLRSRHSRDLAQMGLRLANG